jgi:hypothetical protein
MRLSRNPSRSKSTTINSRNGGHPQGRPPLLFQGEAIRLIDCLLRGRVLYNQS